MTSKTLLKAGAKAKPKHQKSQEDSIREESLQAVVRDLREFELN